MDKQEKYNDEIDLVQLLKVLIKRKWLIIGGTVLVTIAAAIIALLLPKVYQGNGFFQFCSGIDIDLNEVKQTQDRIRRDLQNSLLDNSTLSNSFLVDEAIQNSSLMMKNVLIPEYKKFESQFTNPHKFITFLEKKKIKDEDLIKLKKVVRTADDITQWIEPVYAYSRVDMKELVKVSRDINNYVLGVNLCCENDTPVGAQDVTSILGQFIKDCILYGKLNEYVAAQLHNSMTEAKVHENLIIKHRFKLKQLTEKRDNLSSVLKKYPQSKEMLSRELYSLANSGHRYLSPVAQLVGIESYMADIKENLGGNIRSKALASLKASFFTRSKEILDKEPFGLDCLAKLKELKASFFQDKKYEPDVVQQVENELTIDLNNFSDLKDDMRFISGPIRPKNPVKPNKVLIIAAAFAAAFVMFALLALSLNWWQENRKKLEG